MSPNEATRRKCFQLQIFSCLYILSSRAACLKEGTGGVNCLPCAAGTYALSDSCTSCSSGFYQPLTMQVFCALCPAGSYCATRGLSAVSGDCAAGTSAAEQATACTTCEVGSYARALSAACTRCVGGFYQVPDAFIIVVVVP